MSHQDHLLYLSRKQVIECCQQIDSVALMYQVFNLHASGDTILPDEAYLGWTNQDRETVRSLLMPGYLGGTISTAGAKIMNGNIANMRRGLARASGLTLLFEEDTVRVICILESAYISSLRTASVTAMAAELLCTPPLRSLALLGAGTLALAHLEVLISRFPYLEQIFLFDIDHQRGERFSEEAASLLRKQQRTLLVTSTAQEAIRSAQLVVPVTTTSTGYIAFDWLQPGAVIVNVSLDDPLPEVILRAQQIIVDDWNLVSHDTRRLLGRMYHTGQVIGPDDLQDQRTSRRIDAQLGEIVCGAKIGRKHEDDIILVNPFGMAIEDIAIAAQVYQRAKELSLGVWLER